MVSPSDNAPDRRLTARGAGVLVAVLMVWSVLGTMGASVGQETAPTEPSTLSAYSTFADSMPLQTYFDHQARLIPLGPSIAHAQSEVALPSQSSGIAWLVDGGLANGLHGTTSGNRVPTEASAKQPGGDAEEEYLVAGGPIGDDNFATVRAGRAYAKAGYTDVPSGYANAFLKNLAVFPAAGSVGDDPPGTYDPDATAPNQDSTGTDPQPKGQMGVLSIGHLASTSRSFRDDTVVTSIGVAELKDVNIGNRTSDNRCTNCIRFDSIRTEAYAQASGVAGSARAAYRVILGRACRRGFNSAEGVEQDQCLPLDLHNPESTRGWQSFNELGDLNEQFEKPVWSVLTDGAVNYAVGFRIRAGNRHCSPARARRTSSPKDDPCRNYASNSADGQVAKAVAEGIDVELWTITFSQLFDDADERLRGTPLQQLVDAVDQDHDSSGIQLCGPGDLCDATGEQTIPLDTVKSVRRAHVTLGVARAVAVARPLPVTAAPPAEGAGAGAGGPSLPPPADAGSAAAGSGEEAPPVASGGSGRFALRINWASFGVKPWPPYDMAKAIAAGAMVFAAYVLIKRRRGLRATP